MVTAARTVRGQGDQHSTMLVHTSVLNSVHRSAAAAIGPHLNQLRQLLAADEAAVMGDTCRAVGERAGSRYLRRSSIAKRVPFSAIRPILVAVADSIEVKVENWKQHEPYRLL